jgi:hypothetical protein
MAYKRSLEVFQILMSKILTPSSYLLPDVSAGSTASELWWTSQELSPAAIIITVAVHAHISLGDEQ